MRSYTLDFVELDEQGAVLPWATEISLVWIERFMASGRLIESTDVMVFGDEHYRFRFWNECRGAITLGTCGSCCRLYGSIPSMLAVLAFFWCDSMGICRHRSTDEQDHAEGSGLDDGQAPTVIPLAKDFDPIHLEQVLLEEEWLFEGTPMPLGYPPI